MAQYPNIEREQPPPDGSDQPRKVRLVRELRRLVRDLALLLVVVSLASVFLFQPFKVEGASMEPALADQERILVNKTLYRVQSIERGDVVVFWFPGDRKRSFVKRIIGIPGDVVEIRDNKVLVNGVTLDEPYLAGATRMERLATIEVKSGHYFVLGDHRSVSNDSRSWGQVPQAMILGKASLRYWPPDRAGWIQ